jgi:ABC-type antimicrobial peptide transport system permease subunit
VYPGQQVALYPAASPNAAVDTPMPIRFNDLDDVYVSAQSAKEIPLAIQQITEVLRDRHHLPDGAPDDFSVRDSTEFAQALASSTTLMTNLLLCVALISLIVGGVGIMNIMLVSVTERTREIGLRMAVGARARNILMQFLVEAIVLCLAGGIVGILLGVGSSWLVTYFLGWPTESSPEAIVAAVAVSASVGIIFGYYPAWKASRLDPIEALRYE